jgi:fatty acid-binding protein DegV
MGLISNPANFILRTMSKAVDRLLDLFEERVGSRTPVHIGALHANAPVEVSLLLEQAHQRFPESYIRAAVTADVSPVVGSHTGPGCLDLAVMAGV